MLVKCVVELYQGWATAGLDGEEQQLLPGHIYDVNDGVGRYLTSTWPSNFEKLDKAPGILQRPIRIVTGIPEERMPIILAEAAADKAALLTVLKNTLAKEEAALESLTVQLSGAKEERGELLSKRATLEASRHDLGRLEKLHKKIAYIEGELRDRTEGLGGTRERTSRVQAEVAQERFEGYVQQFQPLLEELRNSMGDLCATLLAAADQVERVWAQRDRLNALSSKIMEARGLCSLPCEQHLLEGAACVPAPNVLKLTNLLVGSAKGRNAANSLRRKVAELALGQG